MGYEDVNLLLLFWMGFRLKEVRVLDEFTFMSNMLCLCTQICNN